MLVPAAEAEEAEVERLLLMDDLSSEPRTGSRAKAEERRRARLMDHLGTSASKSSIRRFVITEKAFSWLKAATTAFTFKTLLRHYAKRALNPRSLNVKLGPRRN